MRLPSWLAQHLAALRALLVFTVLLGLAYPLALVAAGRVPGLADHADGSLVTDAAGAVVGSELIGQSFTDADGKPVAKYFQSRPSAAGDGYDPTASGASNLGPESGDLLDQVCARSRAVAALEGVEGRPSCPSAVPADAVTASGSGLDPHISVAYADLQIPRIARERGLPAATVRTLVRENTTGAAVNVLLLNLALDAH